MKRALSIAFAIALVACSIGETNYESVTYPLREAPKTKTCDSTFVLPDLATLEPCGDGRGHCYPGAKTAVPELPTSTCKGDDVCVPDKVLRANGTKLKSCSFFTDGRPGICASTLMKDIDAHKGQLPPDGCEADERCAPCISPVDQTDTHLCDDTGVHEADCVGGTGKREATCCHGSGVCMNPEAAPADQRDSLHQDACPSKKLCAPAALVDGNPSRCYVFAVPGVCIDVRFASMLGPATPVMRTSCGPTEICLPCAIGKSQGMPGCE